MEAIYECVSRDFSMGKSSGLLCAKPKRDDSHFGRSGFRVAGQGNMGGLNAWQHL
jgi:hypothetical protein